MSAWMSSKSRVPGSLLGVLLLLLRLLAKAQPSSQQDWRDEYLIRWYAPFLSGGGYCSEAYGFVAALRLQNITVVPVHHGDTPSSAWLDSLSSVEQALLDPLSPASMTNPLTGKRRVVIAVCHSEPGAWHAPTPAYTTSRCPPADAEVAIGRTMFETDRLPAGWPARLGYMDYVWVPTDFARDVFVRGMREEGHADKEGRIEVVAEPVDTDFFSPVPFDASLLQDTPLSPLAEFIERGATIFLFVGKWEERKGAALLLSAYMQEFSLDDNVLLLILTSAYHSAPDWLERAAEQVHSPSPHAAPRLLLTALPQALMPLLYSLPGTFLVLPSSGEGWGRPHVESMSCAKPVVATNWSGPTAFLTPDNGYPIPVTRLKAASGWEGHRWADVDEGALRATMRRLWHDHASDGKDGKDGRDGRDGAMKQETAARQRGLQARRDMQRRFGLAVVGADVGARLAAIVRVLEEARRMQGRDQEL